MDDKWFNIGLPIGFGMAAFSILLMVITMMYCTLSGNCYDNKQRVTKDVESQINEQQR